MGKKRFVVSTINLRRDKEHVIEDMHKKLAGGSDGVLSHVRRRSDERLRLVGSYALCILMLGTAATVSALQWKRVSTTAIKVISKYIAPVSMLDQDLGEGKITVDEYARYLSYLLVRFSSLPEQYRSGVPRLSSDEVYARIDSVWASLHPATKAELERRLPRKRAPAVDLNGNAISVSPTIQ